MMLVVTTFAVTVLRERPANHSRESHGALDMQAQTVILNNVLLKPDFTQPPPPIDPLIWNMVAEGKVLSTLE
jgi:hypothetical protein